MEILRTHEYGISLVRGGHLTNAIFMCAKYFHGEMALRTKAIFLGLPDYNIVDRLIIPFTMV